MIVLLRTSNVSDISKPKTRNCNTNSITCGNFVSNRPRHSSSSSFSNQWNAQTTKVKGIYEVEIQQARHTIDGTATDRATAELRAKRAEEERWKLKEKYALLVAGRDTDCQLIEQLEKQLLDNKKDLNLFRRRLSRFASILCPRWSPERCSSRRSGRWTATFSSSVRSARLRHPTHHSRLGSGNHGSHSSRESETNARRRETFPPTDPQRRNRRMQARSSDGHDLESHEVLSKSTGRRCEEHSRRIRTTQSPTTRGTPIVVPEKSLASSKTFRIRMIEDLVMV